MQAPSTPAMYDFPTLAGDSIRLLKIQPELRNGHVACTLNQYDDHTPPYDALSYYWSDPKPTRKIYVNDVLVDIHEALWEFLDQMQGSQQTENWIWTDFLCLNQRNNEEMSQQVPRMGQIYSNAERTISWLGCHRSSWVSRRDGLSMPSFDLEEDLRLIAKKVAAKRAPVERFFSQPELLQWTYVTKLIVGEDRAFAVGSSGSNLDAARRALPKSIKEVVQLGQGRTSQSILDVLSLPYWTRVWITQEVALAKEVTLIFGGVSLDFNDFWLTYKSFFYYMLPKRPGGYDKLRVPIEARAAIRENKVSFQQILRWGQHCNASKPVDRLYGLLGLLACCGDGTDPLLSVLTGNIDYTRDLREVYWYIALTNPSIVDEINRIEVIKRLVEHVPTLGQVLSCPLTPESLRYADNERATPLFRNKARLALAVVDICGQAVMTDSSIVIRDTDAFSEEFYGSWLTKRCARQLWSGLDVTGKLREQTRGFQRLLGSLLLETANSGDMDENDEYQAILVGLQMSKLERRGGGWNCVSHESLRDSVRRAPRHEVKFNIGCVIGPASSQLPCSLLTTSRTRHGHRCRTRDRYLVIRETGWKLSLKYPYSGETGEYWEAILNVRYLIP